MRFLALVGPANVGKSAVLAALMRRGGGPRHSLSFRGVDDVAVPASFLPSAGILALGRFDGRMIDGAERLRPNQVAAIPSLIRYLALERPDVNLVVVDTLAAATDAAFSAAREATLNDSVVVALSASFPVVAIRRPLRHPLAAARALHQSATSLAARILEDARERHGAVGLSLRNETVSDLEAVVERVSCETGLVPVDATPDASTTSPASVIGNTPAFGPGDSRFDPSAGDSPHA